MQLGGGAGIGGVQGPHATIPTKPTRHTSRTAECLLSQGPYLCLRCPSKAPPKGVTGAVVGQSTWHWLRWQGTALEGCSHPPCQHASMPWHTAIPTSMSCACTGETDHVGGGEGGIAWHHGTLSGALPETQTSLHLQGWGSHVSGPRKLGRPQCSWGPN